MIFEKPLFDVDRRMGRVYINDTQVPWEEYSLEIPAFDEADNFTIRAPWFVGGTSILSSNADELTVLASEKDISVQIDFNGQTLFTGLIDSVVWDFDMNGESVSITGRGKIGRMVDRSVTRTIKNRTASSVVSEIFEYHGVTGEVTPTSRFIGTYAEETQTSNTEQNDWGLLNWLAEWEGFVVRVSGNEGFFGPADQLPGQSMDPLEFTYGTDCEVRSLSRNQASVRDIIVEGRSYYSGRTIVEHYPRAPKAPVKKQAKKSEGFLFSDEEAARDKFLFSDEKAAGTKKTEDNDTVQIIRRFMTGLSQEQLRQRVRSIHNELTKFNIAGSIIVPRFVEVRPDRRISLYGVGQGLSLDYYCTKVTYSESLSGVTTEIHISSILKGD